MSEEKVRELSVYATKEGGYAITFNEGHVYCQRPEPHYSPSEPPLLVHEVVIIELCKRILKKEKEAND